MPVPVFTTGEVLTAANMNAVGMWRITTCTAGFTGGTAGSASNGVITVGTNNTSVTISNAFSSSFDNYVITYEGAVGATTGEALRIQIGSATTGYYGNLIYANYSSGTPASVGDNNTANWTHCSGANNGRTALFAVIANPFKSTPTTLVSAVYADSGNAGHKQGYLNNSTSYTGFTILAGFVTTMTGGEIRVYGYNK